MSDGVSIAERAGIPATWAPCQLCNAKRRLDDDGLCCECAKDPLRVELVRLRAETSAEDLQRENEALQRRLDRAERARERAIGRHRDARRQLANLQPLRDAHFALALTEDEHLVLISIMVDVVHEDPTVPALSIYRKLIS